jgi:hypothetical protein
MTAAGSKEERVFEFRLRILDVRGNQNDPPSFLGIVEGFPGVLVHAASVQTAERDLFRALITHLEGLQDLETTRLQLDEFPTIRSARLYIVQQAPSDHLLVRPSCDSSSCGGG